MTDGATTLFVADFDDTTTAWESHAALLAIGDGHQVAIDGVVTREADGALEVQRATDHSTRKGLRWGLLGGAGAVIGRARQVHHQSQLTERLELAVAPGHSGVVALVSQPASPKIRAALQGANAIVESALDDVVAQDIKALARESEQG